MSVVCRECQKEYKSEALLHKHLRSHKLSQAGYYQKYFPRYDRYDGSIILFKNKDFYFTADFNTRANLAAWLTKTDKREVQTYLTDWFVKRKERKGLLYIPSQVELRSLPVPGMQYLNELWAGEGGYYEYLSKLGFVRRFSQVGFSGDFKRFAKSHVMCVDTREQWALEFTIKQKPEILPFGDYKLNDDEFTKGCVVERKSLGDFYSTLSGGFERFEREIQRAQEAKVHLIVLIESPFGSVYAFTHTLRRYGKVSVSPEYIFYNMRNLMQKYPTLQFVFVADRDEASNAIELFMRSNGEYKNVDLQYAYDTLNFKV